MANAVQKITLSSVARHSLQQAGAQPVERPARQGRRLDRGAGREHRAAHPAAEPERPAGARRRGPETGMFEVPAGGRRYRALELLVKQKRLAKTAPVPCVVRDGDDIRRGRLAGRECPARAAASRSINSAPSRPCARRAGPRRTSPPPIFVGVSVVKQRLRLASVSPKLLDIYAEDGMTLEQLMAFTVTADHARQEQVWERLPAPGRRSRTRSAAC